MLDPRKSFFTYLAGIKGSGKSEYAYQLFEGYPYDRIVIDPTRDVADVMRERGMPFRLIESPIPGSWPDWMRDEDIENGRLTLVFQPDMHDERQALDDMDRCVSLAMSESKPRLCWCDEIAAMCNEHSTGPGLRQALTFGRHAHLSLIMCGPRAKKVNPLCVGQADRMVAYRILNKADREALAANIGADQDEFDRLNKSLQKYEHMVWERSDEQLVVHEKLRKWRRGQRPPAELTWDLAA